ncbi:MAG: hypothetical protein KTR20_12245 [Cellvibrionaceae bacterium]|nr:hypothetical protein [Cellvibrionaceae bacterium]
MVEIILHSQWLHNATAGLSHALRDDLPALKQQVNSRVAQLWEITSDHGRSWMISRVEVHNDQQELVICCYQGCDLKHIAPIIYSSAEQQGFASIRFHTQRKGLNRLIVDLGFTPYETVYRKQLPLTQQRGAA